MPAEARPPIGSPVRFAGFCPRAIGKIFRGTPISRRDLVRGLGLGAAVSLAPGAVETKHHASARQGVTAPASPGMPLAQLGGPTVWGKAAELAFDIRRIFRYVADEIAYDAYTGVLRGPEGTLWGMAGNAVDQSLLLGALLDESLIPYRFAVGKLDADTADRLDGGLRLDADALRNRDTRFLRSVPPDLSQADIPDPSDVLARIDEVRQRVFAEAQTMVGDGIADLVTALADAGVELGRPEVAIPERERTAHVWIQYADGGSWIDLDPSLPDAEIGKRVAILSETLDTLPDDLYHLVRIRVAAEVVSGGEVVRQDLIDYEARSADLVGVPLAFTHVPAEAMKEIGNSLNLALQGTASTVPCLFVGEEGITADRGIAFGTGGGAAAILGASSDRDGDTLAEWMEIEVVRPDAPVAVATRAIFDRIGAAERASGSPISIEEIAPVELVSLADGGSVYLPTLGITSMTVAGWNVPPSYFFKDTEAGDSLGDFGAAVHGYFVLRDRFGVELGWDDGYRFYPNAPNVTAFVVTPNGVDSSGEPDLIAAVDIFHRNLATVPIADHDLDIHPGLLSGVLAHVAERFVLDPGRSKDMPIEGLDLSTETVREAVSAGRIFEVARDQQVGLDLLKPGGPGVGPGFQGSAAALAGIERALNAGYVVVVPKRPITIEGRALLGWWEIDPATGYAADRMEDGRGGVIITGLVMLGPMGDFAALLRSIALRAWPAFKRFACLAWTLEHVYHLLGHGVDEQLALGAVAHKVLCH